MPTHFLSDNCHLRAAIHLEGCHVSHLVHSVAHVSYPMCVRKRSISWPTLSLLSTKIPALFHSRHFITTPLSCRPEDRFGHDGVDCFGGRCGISGFFILPAPLLVRLGAHSPHQASSRGREIAPAVARRHGGPSNHAVSRKAGSGRAASERRSVPFQNLRLRTSSGREVVQ